MTNTTATHRNDIAITPSGEPQRITGIPLAAGATYVPGSMPYLDVPSLRRVKPLPRSKRRRVTDSDEGLTDDGLSSSHGALLNPASHAAASALASFPLPPYYNANFVFHAANGATPGISPHNAHSAADSSNYQVEDASGNDEADQDSRDRDQQGNSKKRKVPAQHHFRTSSSDNDTVGDDGEGRDGTDGPEVSGKVAGDGASSLTSSAHFRRSRKSKTRPATAARLKLKDMLKTRKRLLSSAIGALPSEDSLALDLALASPLDWHLQPEKGKERYYRRDLSIRRRRPRPISEQRCKLPSEEFSFTSPSESSVRMKAVLEEVAAHRARFTAELTKIAVKQAEALKKSVAATLDGKRHSSQRKKAAGAIANPKSPAKSPDTGDATGLSPLPRTETKKKKKRSSKTNDPHQIKNYIPSRLPSDNGVPQPPTASQAALNLKNLITPHPLLFLSAEPKPRRSRDTPSVVSSLPPVQPMDEWICSFCEYNLFYGDEDGWRRAIRARKNLLQRRRRARERAAAAASGQAKLLPKKAGSDEESGDEDELPEEEQEAKFVDPAEVDARVAANVNKNAQGKPIFRDKDKANGVTTATEAVATTHAASGSVKA